MRSFVFLLVFPLHCVLFLYLLFLLSNYFIIKLIENFFEMKYFFSFILHGGNFFLYSGMSRPFSLFLAIITNGMLEIFLQYKRKKKEKKKKKRVFCSARAWRPFMYSSTGAFESFFPQKTHARIAEKEKKERKKLFELFSST